MDCGTENHSDEDIPDEWRIGVLTLNMLIKKDNITTQLGDMYAPPHRIILTSDVTMTLDNNIDYLIAYNDWYINDNKFYNIFTLKPNSFLRLNPNSSIKFQDKNGVI